MRGRTGRIVAVAGAVAMAVLASGCTNTSAGSGEGNAGFPAGKTVEVIVPFDAGGFTDVLTRLVATGMSEKLGSQVRVINRPGAGGTIGLTELSAKKPDGYTIGTLNMPSGLTYLDAKRDVTYRLNSFVPVAGLATSPTVIAVRKDSPFDTLQDLIAAAREKPDTISLAGGTNLTSDDTLTVAGLQQAADVRFNVVTVDTGGADKTTQLLGGQIQVTVGSLGAVQSAYKSGDVRILAVASAEPSTLLPGVPTLASAGYDITTSGAITIAAPAGTPDAVTGALESAIEAALSSPDLASKANAAGYEILFRDRAALATFWSQQEADAEKIIAGH
ncbi:hypothetical protein Aple_092380 [Acrocarpospora pleiomorpha]|uniref:Tripartite tricarboxylate transporter substrate binding protein n=1 Tax=Acrocarpospora pleiomorpha TaxID=90975 RepID=A0A5M3Y2C3_9ACTN|nr:tripartite tricarboxylate transporter substrate binding protein [Acrocarpospora pleiomorpha]GES26339.1 hypothetical protein Aple_092380 [Acrocarpospora pleiomorpha]